MYGYKGHYIELGCGQVISSITRQNLDLNRLERNTNVSLSSTVGYRMQKETKNVFFRLYNAFIWGNYMHVYSKFGISIGYMLKDRRK